ncbi:hypothetical protein J2S00_003269 [Caldalkalibacillus uzonensis]|uniref:Cortex morphogenetic protein CmpA n=1 Tax=Caldalkalibacillus uzonensis TaxID=353224 RepID=A0ABU0CVV0_9BACI|nr:cortex morphogenetic protein CmpA [Caldalkalibacillus uzonensis]MDQ0340454.1 hypothetical protein [Caldalkalibacillus uzonensis]
MPRWLQNQLQRAFYEKDLYQIRLLNECWYLYYTRLQGKFRPRHFG